MNASQPLDQLPPLILPDAPGWWPPAPGWWILTTLAIITTLLIGTMLFRRYQANRLRRAAIDEANTLIAHYHADADDQQLLLAYNRLLKRFCLQQFPDLPCASLSGDRWLAQLDELANQTLFSSTTGRQLTGIYQAGYISQPNEIRALHALVMQWLCSVDIAQADQQGNQRDVGP